MSSAFDVHGEFLGKMHGVTFGIRSYLEPLYLQESSNYWLDKDNPRYRLVQLLIEHLDKLRLFLPLAYKDWLETGADRPSSITSLLQLVKSESGLVGLEVTKLIRQDGLTLNEIWQDLCKESERVHRDFGSVGHQGLYAANLFIGYDNNWWTNKKYGSGKICIAQEKARIDKVYLASHSSIALIDPAIEAGLVLAELISVRLSANSLERAAGLESRLLGDESLPRILGTFHEQYSLAFQKYLHSSGSGVFWEDKGFDRARGVRDLIIRLSRVAAISLLARYHTSWSTASLSKNGPNSLISVSIFFI